MKEDSFRLGGAANACANVCSLGAQVDDIFYCPYGISDNCNCRKPEPGMLISAQKKWDIDFARSYIIGDSESEERSWQESWGSGDFDD